MDYENLLGADEKKMKLHIKTVDALITTIIKDKGFNRTAHFDWHSIQVKTLTINHTKEVLKKRPGFTHVEYDHYVNILAHGDPLMNGRGDTVYTLDGVRGVLMKDAPITKIEFNEGMAALTSQQAASTAAGDLDIEGIEALQNAASSGFFGFNKTSVSARLDNVMALADEAEDDEDKQAEGSSPPKAKAKAKSQPSGSSPPRGLASTPFGDLGAAAQPAASPAVKAKPGSLKPKGKAAPTATGSATGAAPAAGAAATVAGAGNAKGAKGRPKKDWLEKANTVNREFGQATSVDPLWFGAEAKTQAKSLRKDIKEVEVRIKAATEVAEVDSLTEAKKLLNGIASVVEAIATHGLESSEYKDAYDLQRIAAGMAPKVEFNWPFHLKQARHKQDIQSTECTVSWFKRIGSSELKMAGFTGGKDIVIEQERLLSGRMVRALKGSDEDVGEFFSSDLVVELEPRMENVWTSVTIMVSYPSLQELDERVNLLGEAYDMISAEIPNRTIGQKGSVFGNALLNFPKGEKIYNDAALHLSKARQTQAMLKVCHEKLGALSVALENLNFLVCPSGTINHMQVLMRDLKQMLVPMPASCLAEFMLTPQSPALARPLAFFARLVCNAWKVVLQTVLKANATVEDRTTVKSLTDFRYSLVLLRLPLFSDFVLELVDANLK